MGREVRKMDQKAVLMCHVHVAEDRRKESLQPFIRSGVRKIACKDLRRELRREKREERHEETNLETGGFFDLLLRRRRAVFCDWGGLGVRHFEGWIW